MASDNRAYIGINLKEYLHIDIMHVYMHLSDNIYISKNYIFCMKLSI